MASRCWFLQILQKRRAVRNHGLFNVEYPGAESQLIIGGHGFYPVRRCLTPRSLRRVSLSGSSPIDEKSVSAISACLPKPQGVTTLNQGSKRSSACR